MSTTVSDLSLNCWPVGLSFCLFGGWVALSLHPSSVSSCSWIPSWKNAETLHPPMHLPDLCPQPVTSEEVPTCVQPVRPPPLESVSNSLRKEGILLQVMSRGQASGWWWQRWGGTGQAWFQLRPAPPASGGTEPRVSITPQEWPLEAGVLSLPGP